MGVIQIIVNHFPMAKRGTVCCEIYPMKYMILKFAPVFIFFSEEGQ